MTKRGPYGRPPTSFGLRHSSFIRDSGFVIRAYRTPPLTPEYWGEGVSPIGTKALMTRHRVRVVALGLASSAWLGNVLALGQTTPARRPGDAARGETEHRPQPQQPV